MTTRRVLLGLLAASWLGAPFLGRHPLVDQVLPAPEPTPLELFIERLDGELPEHGEVALWWPDRDAEGLETLGQLWALGSYELTPRRVFPLLTPREAASIEPLSEEMRPFLIARSRGLAGLDEAPPEPIAVLAWGDEDCRLEDFPGLVPSIQEGAACVLRFPAGEEATPPRERIDSGEDRRP